MLSAAQWSCRMSEHWYPRTFASWMTPVRQSWQDPTIEDLVYRHVRETGRSLLHVKKEIERDCIARALDESGGNITKAASLLGMKRPRLSQLVKSHGLLAAEKEQ